MFERAERTKTIQTHGHNNSQRRSEQYTTSDGQPTFSLQPQHHSDFMFSSILCFCSWIKQISSLFSFDIMKIQ